MLCGRLRVQTQNNKNYEIHTKLEGTLVELIHFLWFRAHVNNTSIILCIYLASISLPLSSSKLSGWRYNSIRSFVDHRTIVGKFGDFQWIKWFLVNFIVWNDGIDRAMSKPNELTKDEIDCDYEFSIFLSAHSLTYSCLLMTWHEQILRAKKSTFVHSVFFCRFLSQVSMTRFTFGLFLLISLSVFRFVRRQVRTSMCACVRC